MSDRADLVRSLLRSSADRVGRELRRLVPVDAVRRGWHALRQQQALVPQQALSAAVAHAEGVEAASVTMSGGAVRVDATFTDGQHLDFGLAPIGARFAPRGAKELLFRVEPTELATSARVADVVSAVAGVVARTLWVFALPEDTSRGSGAIVERDGADRVRVDLRTVPAVRRAQNAGIMSMLLDAVEIRAIHAEPRGLAIEVKLPQLHV